VAFLLSENSSALCASQRLSSGRRKPRSLRYTPSVLFCYICLDLSAGSKRPIMFLHRCSSWRVAFPIRNPADPAATILKFCLGRFQGSQGHLIFENEDGARSVRNIDRTQNTGSLEMSQKEVKARLRGDSW
jgi:hypothetical protein